MAPDYTLGRVVQSESNSNAMYKTLKRLGRGGYGSVYMVKRLKNRRNQDDRTFAMKVINTSSVSKFEFDNYNDAYYDECEENFAAIREEATFLMRLQHPNIVQLEDFAVGREFAVPEIHCCLIMEHANGGILFNLYHHMLQQHKEEASQAVAYQMLKAFQFMHSQTPDPIALSDMMTGNIYVPADPRIEPAMSELMQVVGSMLEFDPVKRPTASALLRYRPWVKAGAHVPRYSMPPQHKSGSQQDELSRVMDNLQF